MKALGLVALLLVVVGAVNWGLVGLAQFDLVAALFGGSASLGSRLVYSLVGLAGVILLATQFLGAGVHRKHNERCSGLSNLVSRAKFFLITTSALLVPDKTVGGKGERAMKIRMFAAALMSATLVCLGVLNWAPAGARRVRIS